MGIESMWL